MENRGYAPNLDAFGEDTPVLPTHRFTPAERRKYAAAVAVFWSLALLLAAGRVHYYAPSTAAAPMELASR